jgi:hypothetical protein
LQESLCSCADIVPSSDDESRPPNELALFCTINALLLHHDRLKRAGPDATNTKSTTIDEHDDGFVDDSVSFLRGIRRTPETLDFNRKRKLANVKFQLPEQTLDESGVGGGVESGGALTEIIEECEYDSDVGKFKCRDGDEAIEQDESENSSTSSMVDHYLQVEHLNNLNSPPQCVNRNGLDTNNIVEEEEEEDESHYKIVMKRIEFFEEKKCEEPCKKQPNQQQPTPPTTEVQRLLPTREDQILSNVLLVIFILSVTLLIIFPLPN